MNKTLAWKSDSGMSWQARLLANTKGKQTGIMHVPPGCLGRKKPNRKHLATLKHSPEMQPIMI